MKIQAYPMSGFENGHLPPRFRNTEEARGSPRIRMYDQERSAPNRRTWAFHLQKTVFIYIYLHFAFISSTKA